MGVAAKIIVIGVGVVVGPDVVVDLLERMQISSGVRIIAGFAVRQSGRYRQVSPAKAALSRQRQLVPFVRPGLGIEAQLLPLPQVAVFIHTFSQVDIAEAVCIGVLEDGLGVKDPVVTGGPAQCYTRTGSVAGIDVIIDVRRIVKGPARTEAKHVVNPTGIFGRKTDQAQGQRIFDQRNVYHGADIVAKVTAFN